MEKESNTNCMYEAATMPSYFPCIKSSESHPLADWLYLKSVITSSPELRMMTETYRKRLAISKQFADQYKPEMPAITVSALMNGYGRQLADFLKPTYMLQLDFDHVKKEDMEQLIQLVRGDSHTMVEYITVSGRGFRVFCAYRPVDDDDISVLELFDSVLQKAMAYYTQLLGIAPDKQCVDITRCAGLAYDPDAYFRWDAEPFALGPKDLNPLYTKKALQAKYSARRNAKGGKRSSKVKEEAKSNDKGAPTIEEAASHIKELLDLWGYRFEPEHHNEYVWHFADICIYYGIPQEEVLTYADREFGTSYEDTASVIKSRYKHLNKFGIWHFYRHGEGRSAKPSVRGIKQWLLTHYLFRRNVLTGFYEVESRFVLDGKYPDWVRIDDNIENSIWSEDGRVGTASLGEDLAQHHQQRLQRAVRSLGRLPAQSAEMEEGRGSRLHRPARRPHRGGEPARQRAYAEPLPLFLQEVAGSDGGGMGNAEGGEPDDTHLRGQGRHLQDHILPHAVAPTVAPVLPQRLDGSLHRQGLHGGFQQQGSALSRRV